MIRTHVIPCKLPKSFADALNLASGQIYSGVAIAHWRILRKKGIWLSEKSGTRLSDSKTVALLHAHSIDAAQQGFYKAQKTTHALRIVGIEATFPYHRKKFRTTVWKNTALKLHSTTLTLSNGRKNPKIGITINPVLTNCLRIMEVRLVYDKKVRTYNWHIVVEDGVKPKIAEGNNIVSVDLGEVHPAVVGDEEESHLITCRALRHQKQGHQKRLAKISLSLSRKQKGSIRYKRLIRTKTSMKAKHKRVISDMEHKISHEIVSVAVERNADTIVIGDVRDVADGVSLGKVANQKISGWSHGKIRQYVQYKAEAEGIKVKLQSEHYTSQTCPHCRNRHKPRGRIYRCPACKFQSHRDMVGQINILSAYKHGEPGKIPVPKKIKHRIPYNLRVMRRCPDTGLAA